jgi:hypothetical protein
MEAHIIVNQKFTNCWQDQLGYPESIMMQKLIEKNGDYYVNNLTKSLFSELFRKHLISIIRQLKLTLNSWYHMLIKMDLKIIL